MWEEKYDVSSTLLLVYNIIMKLFNIELIIGYRHARMIIK